MAFVGVISYYVIVVVMATLTLMTSRLADATGKLDADGHRRGNHGGRAVVTWYDELASYRHNSVLQYDEPAKLEEVYYYYYISLFANGRSNKKAIKTKNK